MNNIKNIRESKGISRRELHRSTGIPLRTLEDWEFDKAIPSKYHSLKKIAAVLECTVDDLMIRKEDAIWNNKTVAIDLELVENGTSIKIYDKDVLEVPGENLETVILQLIVDEVITNACGTDLVNHLKKDRDISDFMETLIMFAE